MRKLRCRILLIGGKNSLDDEEFLAKKAPLNE
jgi:hypothetical protein